MGLATMKISAPPRTASTTPPPPAFIKLTSLLTNVWVARIPPPWQSTPERTAAKSTYRRSLHWRAGLPAATEHDARRQTPNEQQLKPTAVFRQESSRYGERLASARRRL